MFGHGQRRANIGYLRVISLFIRSKHQAPVRREQSDLSVCALFQVLLSCGVRKLTTRYIRKTDEVPGAAY